LSPFSSIFPSHESCQRPNMQSPYGPHSQMLKSVEARKNYRIHEYYVGLIYIYKLLGP